MIATSMDPLEDTENIEAEDDFESVWSQFQDLSLSASDWTVETLYSQIQKGNIDLSPSFQRREVWDKRKKASFIESLVLGIPVPQIVLAQKKGTRGKYMVLDGKQRLMSIKGFYDGEYELGHLNVVHMIRGKYYSSLDDGWRDALDNSTIRAVRISGWDADSVLYTIFHRLNTGSMPLNTQELRSALFPGTFTNFAADYTNANFELAKLFNSKEGPDFRMRDVELLTRYSGLVRYPELFNGSLKDFLDNTTIRLNKLADSSVYEGLASNVVATVSIYDIVYRELSALLGNKLALFSLPQAGKTSRFNRAVFDALCYCAKDAGIRNAIQASVSEVATSFAEVCENQQFIEACSLTTKTRQSLVTRVDLWAKTLRQVIGTPVESLNLDKGVVREYTIL